VHVQLHIMENLAYPIILGCDFLRKERIILRFDKTNNSSNQTGIPSVNVIQNG
jgi:hypothetical protein